jgi:hemerythrin
MPMQPVRMSLINRRHVLGHDIIDAEHAAVAELWLKAVTCERIAFPLHLARLRKAMARHFDHEAALMAERGAALCRHHRNEHSMLLKLCGDALALYECDWRKARSLLRSTLPRLVREHVVSMDQCAVLFLNTCRQTQHA